MQVVYRVFENPDKPVSIIFDETRELPVAGTTTLVPECYFAFKKMKFIPHCCNE